MAGRIDVQFHLSPSFYTDLVTQTRHIWTDRWSTEAALAYMDHNQVAAGDGVCMMSNVLGRYLGHETFAPIFDELQRRGSVVFVHPSDLVDVQDLKMLVIAEWPFDTTRAAIDLVYSGTVRRCADVRVILAHGGGAVPMARGRVTEMSTHFCTALPPVMLDEAVRQIAGIYYDLATVARPNAIAALREVSDLEHVLFACDWPFAPGRRSPSTSPISRRWTSPTPNATRSSGETRRACSPASFRRPSRRRNATTTRPGESDGNDAIRHARTAARHSRTVAQGGGLELPRYVAGVLRTSSCSAPRRRSCSTRCSSRASTWPSAASSRSRRWPSATSPGSSAPPCSATTATGSGARTSCSILATAALSLVALLPESDLLSWGWRIPFVVSFALVGVGLYFRYRVPESPAFLARTATQTPRRLPIVELFRTRPGLVAKSVGIQLGVTVAQGVFTLFGVNYAATVGYSPSVALLALLVAAVGSIVATPLYAALPDRIGRRKVMLGGTIAAGLWTYPGFVLINLGNPVLFVVSIAAFVMLVLTAVNAVVPVLLSELYPTEIRFTGVSMSYQLAQTLGSGFAPLIAASPRRATGHSSNPPCPVIPTTSPLPS